MERVSQAFRRWMSTLDVVEMRTNSAPRAWMGSYPILLFMVALGAWIPGTSDALGLEARPALWAIGFHALLLLDYSRNFEPDRLSVRDAVTLVIGGAALQVVLAAMVACSRPLGAMVYGALLLFTVTVHARLNRVTWDAPFGLLAPVAATVTGLLLHRGTGHTAILLALGVAACWATVIIGTQTLRSAESAARDRRMEQALAAQELERQQAATQRMERRVVDLLGANHDIKNVLSTAILNAASLRKALESASPPDPGLLEKMDKVQQALALVVAISRTSRDSAAAESKPGEPVPLAPTLESVRARLSARWSECTVEVPRTEDAVVLPGGSASLERILENLLVNAAEGDGTRGARRAEVSVFAQGPWLRLAVEDDGPGFPPESPSSAGNIQSTKRQGTGLGLVTVASLVAAARGELSRTNRAGGGARVEVVLPRLDVPREGAGAP